MKLKPAEIRVDGGTQPRAELIFEVMEDYAADMRNGVEFPPVTAFFDGKEYWLADGFHRIGAHLRAFGEDAPIEVEVIQGTQSDAQWYSYGVNKTHGLRRAPGDKERAVRAALQHPKSQHLSDAAIGEHVGVDRKTVLKYRHQTEPDLSKLDKSDAGPPPSHLSKLDKSDAPAPPSHLPKTDKSAPRTGRDGRTINTANIGKSRRRKTQKAHKPRSPAEFVEARRNGYRGRVSSMVKLELPNNHVYNCAFDLLRHFTFKYLQKVFQEVINIHQERLQEEDSE